MTDGPSGERPSRGAPRAPVGLEGVVDDVVGVDFKILRTLRDLVIRPGRVADAALANDHSRYTRPLRVFLAIFAVQTLVYVWLGINDTGTLSTIYADNPAMLAALDARLIEAGSSLAAGDEVIRQWTGWTSWPITAISSLLFMLAIWVGRPSLGPLKSFLLYVVASNASAVAAVPLTALGGLFGGSAAVIVGALLSFSLLFVYAGLVLHRRASDTAAGLAVRIVIFILATLPVVVVVSVIATATIELAFKAETGFWRLGLIAETARSVQ